MLWVSLVPVTQFHILTRCTYAVGNHDFIEAYKCQTVIVQYP